MVCVLQEEIEVKRDTERQDEIKAMKLAWEAAEPGRAVKVLLQFTKGPYGVTDLFKMNAWKVA